MGDSFTCAFCGLGRRGETGDETTQYLHSSVRTGEPGNYKYKTHPDAWDENPQYITWCGQCDGGSAHKYQRYTDTNLKAKKSAYEIWLVEDPMQWEAPYDDPAVHLEKLRAYDEIHHIERELKRRKK